MLSSSFLHWVSDWIELMNCVGRDIINIMLKLSTLFIRLNSHESLRSSKLKRWTAFHLQPRHNKHFTFETSLVRFHLRLTHFLFWFCQKNAQCVFLGCRLAPLPQTFSARSLSTEFKFVIGFHRNALLRTENNCIYGFFAITNGEKRGSKGTDHFARSRFTTST